jgi:hypothetical protein
MKLEYKRLKGFKHPHLRKVVPPEIRLQIYENALLFFEADDDDYSYNHYYKLEKEGAGLCLLLPCILWNLDDYLENQKNNKYWNYSDTSIAFPELTEEIAQEIMYCQKPVEKRIKYLKKWIKELKSSSLVSNQKKETI